MNCKAGEHTHDTVLENHEAPDFTLPTDGGGEVSLSGLRGKNVVLYFYPKDDTPGCTQESKDFRDAKEAFDAANTVIIGISKDSVKKHDKFKEKYCLPFQLASDEDTKVIETYDVWKKKSLYGKTFMGIERSTFLIDADGIVNTIWRKVKVTGHVDEVLAKVKAL